MDINMFYSNSDENPLDNIVSDEGFCGIFRTIGKRIPYIFIGKRLF